MGKKTATFLILISLSWLVSLISIPVAQAEVYGPLPPQGYFENLTRKVTTATQGWWTSIRERVATLSGLSNGKLSDHGPKPEVRRPETGEKALEPDKTQGISKLSPLRSTFSGSVTPDSGLRSPGRSLTAFPVLATAPSITLRTKHPVPALPALTDRERKLAPVKHRLKYAKAEPQLVPATSQLHALTPSLKALKPFETQPARSLPRDLLSLVRALVAWTRHPERPSDEPASSLHRLGTSSSNPLIREKALAFLGWILEEKGYQGLAALCFAEAFAIGHSHDYDSAVLGAAARLARASILPKVFLRAKLDPNDAKRRARSEGLTPEGTGFIALALAERAFDRKDFAGARKLALAVPAGSTWRDRARLLAATALLADAKPLPGGRPAFEAAGRELTTVFSATEDAELFDAAAATLGRVHFLLGNYSAASRYFSQVSRDTNLFIDSAVDNAWALLRSGDRNHAVGNMFTLHTPYFAGAYMPESYFIQSLGYQEICQFGDALTAVKGYRRTYDAAFRALSDFNAAERADPDAHRQDLVAYLSKRGHRLPEIVLRELARHPDFLRRQAALNQLTHEERGLASDFPLTAKELAGWSAAARAASRESLGREIRDFAKARALELEGELKFLTANVSLLEYEIYAGAGRNLAIQGARNFAVDGRPQAAPDTAGKEYWPYEDEIWEDELNNFRSRMVSACAADPAKNGS